MSNDFKVGDVVVCVDNTHSLTGSPLPSLRLGQMDRVTGFSANGWLLLAGRKNVKGTKPRRWQKLPKADEQFTAQIRAYKPIRKGVPA